VERVQPEAVSGLRLIDIADSGLKSAGQNLVAQRIQNAELQVLQVQSVVGETTAQ
jgi:hypothetical protein